MTSPEEALTCYPHVGGYQGGGYQGGGGYGY